uniref:Uncharacterized protein n=1 Tax=Physcomitrium patens TaxID=3218 RepID=A0A2K1IBL8_PHYPA|nr:hypothetical protein PHYPA_030138 [Physcomitrium patens]
MELRSLQENGAWATACKRIQNEESATMARPHSGDANPHLLLVCSRIFIYQPEFHKSTLLIL